MAMCGLTTIFWLRKRENPEVLDYLKAENAYTEAMMAHSKPLREQLYREMRGRIQEDDASVPEQIKPQLLLLSSQ